MTHGFMRMTANTFGFAGRGASTETRNDATNSTNERPIRSVWLAVVRRGHKKRSRTDPRAVRRRSSERADEEAGRRRSSSRADEEPAKPRVVCAEQAVLYDQRMTRARQRVARLREARVTKSDLGQQCRMPSEASLAAAETTAATVVNSVALSAQSDEVVPAVWRASRPETMDAPDATMVMYNTPSGQELTPIRGDATLRWGKLKARVRITLVANIFVKTLVDAAPRRAAERIRAAASRAAAERVAAAASRRWRKLRRRVAVTVLCNVLVRTLLDRGALEATAVENHGAGQCRGRPGCEAEGQ